jgi:hypothetical protein
MNLSMQIPSTRWLHGFIPFMVCIESMRQDPEFAPLGPCSPVPAAVAPVPKSSPGQAWHSYMKCLDTAGKQSILSCQVCRRPAKQQTSTATMQPTRVLLKRSIWKGKLLAMTGMGVSLHVQAVWKILVANPLFF